MSVFEDLAPYAGRVGIFPTYIEGDLAKVPAGAKLFPDLQGEERSAATGGLVVDLRDRATTIEEIEAWWSGSRAYGVGVNCGDFQCIDFDDPTIIDAWRALLRENGIEHLLESTARAKTMSGGFHVWAYVPGCREESHKLARHAAPVYDEGRGKDVLARIETRGYGGYALIPPSQGYRWLTGKTLLDLTPMDPEQLEQLITAATILDEGPPEKKPEPYVPRSKREGEEESPNDWFERTASWDDLLTEAGGAFFRQVGHRLQYTRPGKRRGVSITTGNGRSGQDLAKVHTPNWPPFQQGESMSKYYCYAIRHHGRDTAAATRAIAQMPGYPGRNRPREARTRRADQEADAMEETEVSLEDSPLDLPSIQWNSRQLPHVTSDAIGALVASNDPRHLFDRGGKVVRVVEGKEGTFKIDNLGAAAMRNEIGKAANWVRMTEKGKLASGYVPKEIAENILAEQGLSRLFPSLEGLSSVPVLSLEGTYRRAHGYDPESRFFVTDHGPFPMFEGNGRDAATYLLEELFSDFPFEDQASRANALALALLPFVRPAIDGPTPMHFVRAPQSRTGKSLLIEVALRPSLGAKGVSSTPLPEKEEELNKALAGMVFEGDQLVFFDNAKRKVSSASLEQLLTANYLRFRPLGTTTSIMVPVRAIFALTSNNGTLSVDMAGRTVLIGIDARMERPEDREGFRHADIRAFIDAERPNLRAACMAMVEEWVRAGKPKAARRKASFEDWSRKIGGILEVCGVEGFLGNDRTLKGSLADEDEPWRDFFEAWWVRFGDHLVTGPDLMAFAIENKQIADVFEAKTDSGRSVAFGKAMTSHEGRVLEGKRLEAPRNAAGKPHKLHGQKTFRLVSVDGTCPPPVDGQAGLIYDVEEVDPFADD